MTITRKNTREPDTESCCPDSNPCADPEKCLLRKQRSAFLESLFATSPLPEADTNFLFAYFDVGPGGSETIDLRDFAIMFGMSEMSMVLFRVAILLERLKKNAERLGYRKPDFY